MTASATDNQRRCAGYAAGHCTRWRRLPLARPGREKVAELRDAYEDACEAATSWEQRFALQAELRRRLEPGHDDYDVPNLPGDTTLGELRLLPHVPDRDGLQLLYDFGSENRVLLRVQLLRAPARSEDLAAMPVLVLAAAPSAAVARAAGAVTFDDALPELRACGAGLAFMLGRGCGGAHTTCCALRGITAASPAG